MDMTKKWLNALNALFLLGIFTGGVYAAEEQTGPYPGYGMGPGMMRGGGGWHMGQGMMGPGMMYGQGPMGPGMMYGQGPMGPGMMYGQGPMGPGMMYGQGSMGPGMMYGQGPMGPGMMYGRGPMGPGMMYGQGPMMGPGMMYGYGPGSMLNLDESQQKKMAQIQDDLRKKHWDVMGRMNEENAKLGELYSADKRDPDAIGKQMQRVFDLRRQMMVDSMEAQNRMEAVLTDEQKEQMRSFYGPGGMMWQ